MKDIFLLGKSVIDTSTKGNEVLMNLSPIYLERLAEAEQKGQRTVIENLLKAKFGSLDDELNSIVQPLLALRPEEFSPLLLQLSCEELISRFKYPSSVTFRVLLLKE